MKGDNTCSKNFNSDEMKNNIYDSGLQVFNQIVKKEVIAEVVALNQELDWIKARFAESKSKLLTNRIPRLWLQYMEMLGILSISSVKE